MTSRLARLGWIVSSGPAMLLGALVLHALSVRLHLARWPIVYQDSPETISLQAIEYGLIVPLLYGSLFDFRSGCWRASSLEQRAIFAGAS